MRSLHLVKTSDGAHWAAHQAAELVKSGVDVHVALPSLEGRAVALWRRAGAKVHEADLDFPVRKPWTLPGVLRRARRLVSGVAPDLIHSHFVGTTQIIRYALGKNHPVPRIYQVAGPLHLEHFPYRRWELSTAGTSDYWIGSSRCINRLYRKAGVPGDRLFLSYYGQKIESVEDTRSSGLRRRLNIPDSAVVIGNINFMYPPKRYLGQRVGLKCHEDVIDALGSLLPSNPNWYGVLLGGVWGRSERYLGKLRRRARSFGTDRLLLPGFIGAEDVGRAWPDFDVAVHVPLSENCGGVIEPMLAGVPVVASRVGGLPEVVSEGVTGRLVESRNPRALAAAVTEVVADLPRHREMARRGSQVVRSMFDVRRTAAEVFGIYQRVLSSRAAA
ncbi:MAG: glycosyltransferase family 4 protein [Elusimicrobia bacterium]|nr:glycosyltransferase family 4 protein [Elusimicrobiota bacterium]